MEVVLHLGQSKTGTSAIQAFLTLNRLKLREAGILYPMPKIAGRQVDLGNHNTLADVLLGHIRYPHLSAQEYFDQFFKEAQEFRSQKMILSAEHFFHGEPRIWNMEDEDQYFELYSKKILHLSQHIGKEEITLLVYLRPQADWLASTISQTVRIEGLIAPQKTIYKDDARFFEKVKPLLRYFRLLSIWDDILNPIKTIVLPYHHSLLIEGSSVADFLSRVGLENLDLPIGSTNMRVNKSLSWKYIEVKKRLNRIPKHKNTERAIIQCLEDLNKKEEHYRPYQISVGLRKRVMGFVSKENRLLAEIYMNGKNQLASGFVRFDGERVSSRQILEAKMEFRTEYSKKKYRLLELNFWIRDFLRQHVKPLHSLLHRMKMAYKKAVLARENQDMDF